MSKKGDAYGEIFFEDLSGRIKVLCFKDRWAALEKNLRLDVPYFLEGRMPESEEANIYLENLQELEAMLKKKARKIVITINYDQIDENFNEKLQQKLEKNRDSVPIHDRHQPRRQRPGGDQLRSRPGDQGHRLDEKRHRKTDRPEFHRDTFLKP